MAAQTTFLEDCMSFITWNQKYVTGNQTIDQQHQKLVDVLNQLHEAMRTGKGQAALSALFDELVSYTDYHFKTEESLFGSLDYAEKAAHIQEHRDLVRQALELQASFKAGTAFLSAKVLDFLEAWVSNHILKMDMTYKGKL